MSYLFRRSGTYWQSRRRLLSTGSGGTPAGAVDVIVNAANNGGIKNAANTGYIKAAGA